MRISSLLAIELLTFTFYILHFDFKKHTVLYAAIFLPLLLSAQPTTLPQHSRGHYILERMAIGSSVKSVFHPEIQPFTRSDAVQFTLEIATRDSGLSKQELRDIQYVFDDNTEWVMFCQNSLDSLSNRCRRNRKPLLKWFYRTPANFFEVNSKAFHLRVNPMLNLAAGQERDDAELVFLNQRGLEVRGDVDGRVFFYTNLLETQARFPQYVNRWVGDYRALPGAGFYKTYKSELFDIRNGYDFNLANAYVGGHLTKHISAQFGHGRHFIGNGYRSLFLSDAGNYTFYLKLSTRIWKLHYQNLFLELSPISTATPRPANSVLPKKYAAVHYLSVKLKPDLAFGFFEATVFNRGTQFEWQYLNPVILYRSVEGAIGSPDNVLVGIDGRWNFLQHFQLYGQLLIDEFLFSEIFQPDQKGWWGNKFAWQAGLKYIDAFGIDHLDIQLEYNTARPFTWSSFDSLNSYTHYNQPLAHPLWANFKEAVGIIRYQPLPRLFLSGRLIYAQTGENTATENWGANPLVSNTSRKGDYGHSTGQGVDATIVLAGLDASWELYHNIYLDLHLLLRTKDSSDDTRDLKTQLFSLGARMNIWNPRRDF